MQNRTGKFIRQTIIWIAIIGLVASFYLGSGQSDTNEIPFIFLYQNGLSLYFQSAIYIIAFTQVVRFRAVRNFVEVRNQTNKIVANLAKLIVIDWAVFWVFVLVPYCLLHSASLFKLGNWRIGLIVLLMHMLLMLILMLILVGAYRLPYPYLIVIFSILATLIYHYNIENPLLLPKYSLIFDPMYRAIHHIYF